MSSKVYSVVKNFLYFVTMCCVGIAGMATPLESTPGSVVTAFYVSLVLIAGISVLTARYFDRKYLEAKQFERRMEMRSLNRSKR